MVRGIEDLRTPLSTIIRLDKELRGTLSGFMMPAFVIDLPGGGGKRLVSTYESYDETTGVAVYRAPGLPGKKGTQTYEYHDPKMVTKSAIKTLRQEQEQALEQNVPLEELARPVTPRREIVRRAPVPQLERTLRIPITSPTRHLELIPTQSSHPGSWPVPPPPTFSHVHM
jgi:lysine 2,3-aminomutase